MILITRSTLRWYRRESKPPRLSGRPYHGEAQRLNDRLSSLSQVRASPGPICLTTRIATPSATARSVSESAVPKVLSSRYGLERVMVDEYKATVTQRSR